MIKLAGERQRGAALIVILGWCGLLLPVVTWLWVQAHSDQLVAQNVRRELDAFYAAEAGLSYALAAIAHCADPACALAGPDGQLGTPHDGGVAADPNSWISFGPHASFHIRFAPLDAAAIRVRATGRGWGSATAAVDGVVRWGPDGKAQVFTADALDS